MHTNRSVQVGIGVGQELILRAEHETLGFCQHNNLSFSDFYRARSTSPWTWGPRRLVPFAGSWRNTRTAWWPRRCRGSHACTPFASLPSRPRLCHFFSTENKHPQKVFNLCCVCVPSGSYSSIKMPIQQTKTQNGPLYHFTLSCSKLRWFPGFPQELCPPGIGHLFPQTAAVSAIFSPKLLLFTSFCFN